MLISLVISSSQGSVINCTSLSIAREREGCRRGGGGRADSSQHEHTVYAWGVAAPGTSTGRLEYPAAGIRYVVYCWGCAAAGDEQPEGGTGYVLSS